MTKYIFISFNYNDLQMEGNLETMFNPSGGPIQGTPIWVKQNVLQEGENAIKREIRSILDQCVIALFLIGQNIHNSPWIEYEYQYAHSTLQIPCIGVNHPHDTYGVPNIAPRMKRLSWDLQEIAAELNRIH